MNLSFKNRTNVSFLQLNRNIEIVKHSLKLYYDDSDVKINLVLRDNLNIE